ncbi:MAG TPA: LytTR family DNA-binding domain-containing protein [Polyangiaceae bacterium]|nr:LytTR family DNA-binding domain-containing protein [Polyangiaceae bacterium]
MPRPLRALVVEDEWPARNYLVELLETSGLAEVVGAVGSLEEARQALTGDESVLGIDVAFIDVQIDGAPRGETGLSLVRSMAATDRAPMFVLATAFEEHALEAYELGVVDYLLKPFSEERVVRCLERLQQRRGAVPDATRPTRIVARRKRSLVFLEPPEIWAFEAADRLTFVHTLHGTFDIDLSLAAVETSFGRAFVRVHRNWLVNATHIKELERDGHETKLFVGSGVAGAGQGVHVPVARERSAAVREMLLTNAAGLRRP